MITTQAGILPHVSSFKTLLKIIVYCFRFGGRCKLKIKTGTLTIVEIMRAEEAIIRIMQREVFPQEVHCLQTGHPIQKNSALTALDPFLDTHGLIRRRSATACCHRSKGEAPHNITIEAFCYRLDPEG